MLAMRLYKNSGLFGHQPRFGLFMPLDDGDTHYKSGRRNESARYNHDWRNNGPDARLREIRAQPEDARIKIYDDKGQPICCRHMHVMKVVRDSDGRYVGYACADCKREDDMKRRFLCSHPQQMSEEELILVDAIRLDRYIRSHSSIGNDYMHDGYTRQFVNGWVGRMMPKLIAMDLV